MCESCFYANAAMADLNFSKSEARCGDNWSKMPLIAASVSSSTTSFSGTVSKSNFSSAARSFRCAKPPETSIATHACAYKHPQILPRRTPLSKPSSKPICICRSSSTDFPILNPSFPSLSATFRKLASTMNLSSVPSPKSSSYIMVDSVRRLFLVLEVLERKLEAQILQEKKNNLVLRSQTK